MRLWHNTFLKALAFKLPDSKAIWTAYRVFGVVFYLKSTPASLDISHGTFYLSLYTGIPIHSCQLNDFCTCTICDDGWLTKCDDGWLSELDTVSDCLCWDELQRGQQPEVI